MSLPEHTKLKYEECYAKIILEHCFPQKYCNLLIEDKPDLYDNKNDIGIEVTSAIKPDFREAQSLWSEMQNKNPAQQERAKERMRQLHYAYQGGIQTWGANEYDKGATSQDYDIVYKMIESKLQKLNRKGLYKDCQSYALFVESFTNMEQDWINQFIKQIKVIYDRYDKIYDIIYFLAQNDIMEIDMIQNKCSNMISIDNCQGELARLACKMVKDGESHDQT